MRSRRAGLAINLAARTLRTIAMKPIVCALLTLFISVALRAQETGATADSVPAAEASAAKTNIYVIPIRDQIAEPVLYIVRTGVKDAIAAGAEFVVLDMNTPGGALDVTLEIMEILDRFEGTTVTYVDNEAVSAGAFISAATDKIYFSPSGVIGAAAPVSSTGEDINETMRQKVVSYLRARIRSISADHPYRGEVISAMVDAEYELQIGDTVIKPKGELLSLTADEAMATYGEPPQPLLGAGIAGSLAELCATLTGSNDYEVRHFEVTWSIKLAQWLTAISPLLMGLGGLLLFIEFKTPGFGVFGVAGVLVMLVVFFGHNLAGLSGHEPALFFLLGVALVFVELLLAPGAIVFAVSGLLLMLGSLLWGMADIWPGDAFELTPEMFLTPGYKVSLGFLVSLVLVLMVARFLPKSGLWNRMVLAAEIGGVASHSGTGTLPGTGTLGTVVTPLHPVGQIDVDGRRFEARSELGEITPGTRVRVVRAADFVCIVEPVES